MSEKPQISEVALIACDSYAGEQLKTAIRAGLAMLGGIERFFRPGEKVLLKPNILSGREPQAGVTTHPEMLRALIEIGLDYGLVLSYGDSPAFGKPITAAKKAGLSQIAAEYSVPMADFENGQRCAFPEGSQHKQLTIAQGALAADGLTSLARLKTHHLTRITGAVKNQFGIVPGFLKPEFHVKLPEVARFARMLVDVTRFIRPRLYILDAIQAMQGNGPSSGELYPLGLILMGADPVALDTVACRLIDLDPARVATNRIGQETALGNMDMDRIRVLGENVDKHIAADFQVERGPTANGNRFWKYRLAKNLIATKPVIIPDNCTCCGLYLQQCPVEPKVLSWPDGQENAPPVFDYHRCIRCFCCQEVCPSNAIRAKRPLLRRLIDAVYG